VTRTTLTLELAAFTVRDGADQALSAERLAMLSALRRTLPGVVAAWLTKQDRLSTRPEVPTDSTSHAPTDRAGFLAATASSSSA
jgi:hypothetical protein